jgi:hypothetical protein
MFSSGGITMHVRATSWLTRTDARTPAGAGMLSLATPILVDSNLFPTFGYSAVVELTYVPEPTALLLLSAGLPGLALQRVSRR